MIRTPQAGRATLVLMACDANFPILVLVGYGLLRLGDPLGLLVPHPWLLLTALAFPVALSLAKAYNLRASPILPRALLRIAGATLAVAALFGLGYTLSGDEAGAPGLFAILAVAVTAEVLGVRAIVAVKARRMSAVRSALVVGAGGDGCTVVDCTLREPRLRVRVVGFVDDDPLKRSFQYKGLSVVGNGLNLQEAVARHGVDLIIVAVSRPQNAELIRNLLRLKMSGVEVVEMPVFFERATGQCPIRHVGDTWFLHNHGFDFLHRRPLQRLKRGGDVLISLLALIVSLPLQGLLALLIKLESRGPVLSLQERVGKGEKPFLLMKFRTLRSDAGLAGLPELAGVRDYRVTRVGRWLRLTRLDELPQLVNVLRGEMSFVGPRAEHPLQVEKLKTAIPYYSLRFAVKPGLAGWAQAQAGYGGSTGEEAVEKLKYDLYYIKNMSFLLDAIIMLKTLRVIVFARGS